MKNDPTVHELIQLHEDANEATRLTEAAQLQLDQHISERDLCNTELFTKLEEVSSYLVPDDYGVVLLERGDKFFVIVRFVDDGTLDPVHIVELFEVEPKEI